MSSAGALAASGRYETIRQIASGGMATVYLGRVVALGGFQRLVAIKKMHPNIAENEDFVSMFLDEARLAASIRHPNVVATLDVDEGPDGLFLVMEYVEGASLQRITNEARKQNERLPLPVTLRILLDTLAGLQAAHDLTSPEGQELNLVHRDVSPQNVLVGIDGVSRLTDFGVARAEARLATTREGVMKGKIAYMAPEQLRGDAIDRRADVYSAGVLLWEALAGRRLFSGDSTGALMQRVLEGAKESPRDVAHDVPIAIDEVCMRALRDPDERFPSAVSFADALEDAAAKAGIPVANARQVGYIAKNCSPTISAPPGGSSVGSIRTVTRTQGQNKRRNQASEPPQPAYPAGRVIGGKFVVEGVIGEGGMGVVLKAKHLQLDEHVALKFLRIGGRPDLAARFTEEARAAVKLKSEYVARTFDVGVEDGMPYIVMEYLEGRDLGREIEAHGLLPVERGCELIVQACAGVAEAHARGFVHRDIKPENLFLAERGDATSILKILDFGITVAIGADRGQVVGSPAYMSPEQFRGDDVDFRSDIWSLGAVLFELLTGTPPFDPTQPVAALVRAIQNEPPRALLDLRPTAPLELQRVIQRCLEKEPAARYSSAAELAVELLKFAPRSARVAADRAVRVTRASGLSSEASLVMPPSMAPPSLATPAPAPLQTPPMPAHAAVAADSPAGRDVSVLDGRSSGKRRMFIVAGVVAAFVLLGGVLVLRRQGAPKNNPVAPAPPSTAAALTMGAPAAHDTAAPAVTPAPSAVAPVVVPAARAPAATKTWQGSKRSAPAASAPAALPPRPDLDIHMQR